LAKIVEMFFLPPLAISRLGGSDTPLDSFRWVTDPGLHSGNRTTIEPAPTIHVAEDGTSSVQLPTEIRFRDGDKLRPVAPFFELWVRSDDRAERPLTLDVLDELKVSLADLRFRVTVANQKARRLTQTASCGFVASVDAKGDMHCRQPLRAFSPKDPDHPPLVRPDAPVPLGHFQVIRPQRCMTLNVDLSIVRVRFTPAKGEVYGPPTATAGIPTPLPEGQEMLWERLAQGRMHEVVPPQNRILAPDSAWTAFIGAAPGQTDPQPGDNYDGAAVGTQRSWGVVDDSCDGIIEAHLVVPPRRLRLSAFARVTAGAPDYAPDRRTFVSLADDLDDRASGPDVPAMTADEVADLFKRVWETASQINVDAERYRAVRWQPPATAPPLTDLGSMTKDDGEYVRIARNMPRLPPEQAGVPSDVLDYADNAATAHSRHSSKHELITFLHTNPDHVRRLVRPPYGRFRQFERVPGTQPSLEFRDPRRPRDTLHDMRMPPYLRDSDSTAMSITWRQHRALIGLLDKLANQPGPPRLGVAAAPAIAPRNLTARAACRIVGNPDTSRPEDTVGNCYPGLDIDVRNLDRRFFPGLVFEFVCYDPSIMRVPEPNRYGALLLYPQGFGDRELLPAYLDQLEPPDRDWIAPLQAGLHRQLNDQVVVDQLRLGAWYIEWIEQAGNRLSTRDSNTAGPLDGLVVWRFVRGLEPGEVKIGLQRRDGPGYLELTGWRRLFTDPRSGVLSLAYQPGELLMSLCSPWQHDFRDCACHYWAANRPDVVQPRVPEGTTPDDIPDPTRLDWMRADRAPGASAAALSTVDANRAFAIDHFQINQAWQRLSVVLNDTEIDEVFAPPPPQHVPPFRTLRRLYVNLRYMAGVEMALTIEYLYARSSLRAQDRRDPDLVRDVEFARHVLLQTAESEMQHLRWANELLWELARLYPELGPYVPALKPARRIPCRPDPQTGRPRTRRRALRRLEPAVVQDFIDVERPSGTIDSRYARIFETLLKYKLKDLAELASHVTNDGMQHFRRFLRLQQVLTAYQENQYLRRLRLDGPDQAPDATNMFREITEHLTAAYKLIAQGSYGAARPRLDDAIRRMPQLLDLSDWYADRGVGIPFWWPPT
jgi:Ferritin-like